MKKVVFTITVVVLILAFCVSGFMVVNYLKEGKEQSDKYDDLSQIVASAQSTTEPQTAAPEEETQPDHNFLTVAPGEMLPGYKELYEMNPDTVGWIKIEGTKIDYPVMQRPAETDYYLYRDFDGNESRRGSLYAREVCDVNKPSDNITIYGHHMADGSMFAALNDYTSKEAWENNPLITFDTLTEFHVYKIFAVFKTSANLGEGFSYHQFVDASNEAEFNDFVSTCKKLAFYDTGITPVYGDKMICLSTCEYTQDNGRLVVAAVRIT